MQTFASRVRLALWQYPQCVSEMIQTPWAILYGSTPAEFKSDYSLEDSIARLRAATRRSVFQALGEPAAVGRVNPSSVRLKRVIPMVGNSFKPFFVGHFETRNGGVYLVGRFSMLWFSKAVMTAWLGFMLTFAIVGAILTYRTGRAPWLSLGGIGMFGAGLFLVTIGKWFARNDAGWLSEVIGSALATTTAARSSGATTTSPPVRTPVRPIALNVAPACLLLMGLASLLAAATGISSYQATPGHVTITHLLSWAARAATGIYALVTIFLAVGIYRREKWAWRLGLAYLGVAWLYSASAMSSFSQIPVVLRVVFFVLSLAVGVYWGLWWYAQRVHFPDTESQTR